MSVGKSTIIVGYLATAEGGASFEHAKQWALATEARLVVVNTGRNGDYAHPNFATAQDLEAIETELAEARVAHEVLQPTDGKPAAEAILAAAATHSADLVIIGLRRRTSVGKAITGSTAQQILLDAPLPRADGQGAVLTQRRRQHASSSNLSYWSDTRRRVGPLASVRRNVGNS